jgi:hypothetical protein
MSDEEDSGTEKVSSGPSESEASSGSAPVSSGGSGSDPSSGPVDCICDVAAVHWDTFTEGGSSTVTFRVGANGTCDVTITGFSTSYGGDHAFTGGEPFLLPAGTEEPYTYARAGDPSGDEIFVHYICENGHEDTIGFTIP